MVDTEKLAALNQDIYEKARVDREHLLEFLRLLNTNDGQQVADAVRAWLEDLHGDTKYSKIYFPQGDIDAILSDLTSYDRLQPNTLLRLQQSNSHELRAE